MKQSTSTALGFLVASILPAAWLAVTAPLSDTFNLRSVAGSFVVFYFFSAVATIFFGVPAFLLLRRLGFINWWFVLVVGFCIGGAVAIILRLPNLVQVDDFLKMGPLGAMAALGFWLVWRMGNQNDAGQLPSSNAH